MRKPNVKKMQAECDAFNAKHPVGADGWSRIINSNDKFDGMEFEQDDEKCTCIIFRKDRSHPIKVTEYMSECRQLASFASPDMQSPSILGDTE